MASGKTLNAANLEALGAPRLAALLLEIGTGDAGIKRRLRLALAGSDGAAREIVKRLASLAKARSFLDWDKIKPLASDLESQRRAIMDLVAPTDPREAFELIWRLVACAESVLARSDDSNGRLSAVFHSAARELGPLAKAASIDPADLANRAFTALSNDRHDAWSELVPILAPQLGKTGLRLLKKQIQDWQAEPIAVPPEKERRVVGWSSGSGKIYADQIEANHRRYSSSYALKQIADALGDVDGFIAQFDAKARTTPTVSAEIARRLLAAGRPQKAWEALEALDRGWHDRTPIEWEQARTDTLDALGRSDEAQEFRWARFLATLNATHLRAYLKKLPDFEDFDAEQRAMAHALAFGDLHQALAFLAAWPDLQRASQLVLGRAKELNGDFYELLSPAADALDEKHPLAATVLRRAMIDFTLGKARSARYKHAARHLAECANLARRVADFGDIPDHAAYAKTLRAEHGRKAGFWQEVTVLR